MSAANTQQPVGCLVVIGFAVEQLAQAMLAYAQPEGLVVYQVMHARGVDVPIIQHTPDMVQVSVDVLSVAAVRQFFQHIHAAQQQVDCVLFQSAAPISIERAQLLSSHMLTLWNNTASSATNIAQIAIEDMLKQQRGTLILLGSAHAAFATEGWLASGAMQSSMRALSQSLAREFQSQGVHVSYLALTHWSNESQQVAQAVAHTCWHIYKQHNSAWSLELSMS